MYLAKTKKIDLYSLINELGLSAAPDLKVAQLCKIVEEGKIEDDFVKGVLSNIVSERESSEKLQKEREERQYELQKLKLELEKSKSENGSGDSNLVKSKDILKSIARYETGSDISVYLELFERQISRAGVTEENYVSFLLGFLPIEIVGLIAREPDTIANDYKQIKKLLLTRFRLTPEQFRQKFIFHKKEVNSSYRDFAFELNKYFESWIEGMQVTDFQGLKELMVTDQLKKRMPSDVREHFIDDLHKIKNVQTLVSKIEDYEAARSNFKKEINKDSNYSNQKSNNKSFVRNSDRAQPPPRNYPNYSKPARRCFSCNSTNHIQAFCKNKKENVQHPVNKPLIHRQNDNNTRKETNGTLLANSGRTDGKIYKTVKVRGKGIECVCDTGSDLTLGSRDFYLEIGSPQLKTDGVKLMGICGEQIDPIGVFSSEITIDDYTVVADIYVLEKLCKPLVLGMDVLNKLDISLNNNGLHILGEREIKQVNLVGKIVPQIEDEKTRLILRDESIEGVAVTTEMGGAANGGKLLNECESVFLAPPPSPMATKIVKEPDISFLAAMNEVVNINEIELVHILDLGLREELESQIKNYKPCKTKETELKMNIILNDDVPIFQRARRIPFAEQKIVEKQIQDWLEEGVIKPSCSEYAQPIVLCKKKNGGYRVTIDFRKLNKKILRDHFPLPLIEDVVDHLANAKVFTSLDLKNGFFHVKVDEKCTKYTSFITHEGQYEFLKMPFGLSNGPSVFQRYIYNVFRDMIRDKILVIYLDDIMICAENEKEGLEKLKRVFKRASEYGLEFNFAKCQFLRKRIEFLGYVIENGTIEPSPGKTQAVKNFPQPKNTKQVQSFLGLTGYFRKFISGYSKIAKPLSDLLRDNTEFKMEQSQIEAFENLKEALSRKPVLHIYRQGATLELHTDASSHGFGAILLQQADDGKLYPIYYMSKKTTAQQEKYCSYELEVLAIIEAVKKFRHYLLGTKFKIVTDCAAFQKTLDKKELTPKIARWSLLLEEFDFDIVHRPGTQMRHVDALSRNTVLIVNRSENELTNKIKRAQEEDDHIQMIKVLIDKGEAKDYLIKNDILYRYVEGKDLLVVPLAMQAEIIKRVHNKGHFASAKTEESLKQEYYIPKARKQIESIITNCIECILCNKKRGKGEGLLNPIPKESIPLNTYHVDFIGPLPSTNKNYQHIFSVIDAFTKFTWFYPVKSVSAKDAIDKLKIQQSVFGNPSRIISDKGSAFNSNEFSNYCQEEGIEHIQITTGIPRGNGQVERIHNTIIPVLAKLSIEDPTKWFKYVADVQRIINSTVTRSTKYTPFELLIGVKMRNREDQRITELLQDEYLKSTIIDRDNLRDEAKSNILKLQQENKRQFNRKRKPAHVYKVNDLVAIQRTQFGSGLKLRSKFFGPYTVKAVKRNDRYEVQKLGNHEGPNVTSTAADHMKPWSTGLAKTY